MNAAAQGSEPEDHPLHDPQPPFLAILDSDPPRAWREFYDFAWRYLRTKKPYRFSDLDPLTCENLISETVLTCGANNFEALRKYVPQGLPFGVYLARIANNKAIDLIRRRILEEKRIRSAPDPDVRSPDRDYRYRALLEAVEECMLELRPECRLLLRAAAEEFKPREIARLLGAPSADNKAVADRLAACRGSLKRLLRKKGIDRAVLETLETR
jgi:RNA polymerase sigma factor (sigma-70 family)